MSRQVIIEFPDEVPEEMLLDPAIVKEGKMAMVLQMLRRGTISQGRAAELLEIDRNTLFDLIEAYRIPGMERTEEELKKGGAAPLGQVDVPEEDPTTTTSGAWKGLLDCQAFEKEVYESRLLRTRPEVRL